MRPITPFDEPVLVAAPLLPNIQEVASEMEELWKSKWLTNHGVKHNHLEESLCGVLKVPNVSVFNNGTMALLVALKALDLPAGSEVITTPFTFAATPHCLSWNGLKPVFSDIAEDTMVLDAEKIEKRITKNTSAILAVHVYGFPCDAPKIQQIADKHNLKVIYDAAHAFGTEIEGKGIGSFGDISMFSFHATKLFHTIEGGCLAYNHQDLKSKIYFLRNFGIKNEECVADIGINGKLNEIQAVIGLLNLKLYKKEQQKRAAIRSLYQAELSGIDGIALPKMPRNSTDSHQYFVIKIEAEQFGMTRDELYAKLKEYNVFTRKYFYPLCSEYEPYKDLPSACESNLPVANKIKSRVLCLPFHGQLTEADAFRICEMIRHLSRKRKGC